MTSQLRCHSSPEALFTVQHGDGTRPNPATSVFPIFIAGVEMKSKSQHKDSRRQKEINMEHSHAPRDMQTRCCFDFPLAVTEKGTSFTILSVQSSRKG